MDATTSPVECRHCGNNGTMRILAEARETEDHEENSNPMFPIQWEAGKIYQTLRCYTCNQVRITLSGFAQSLVDRTV
jgi:phage FluMu protein Com